MSELGELQSQVKQLEEQKSDYNKIYSSMRSIVDSTTDNQVCIANAYNCFDGQQIANNNFSEIFQELYNKNNSILEKAKSIMNDCESKIDSLRRSITILNKKIEEKKQEEMVQRRNEAAIKQSQATRR